MKKFKLQRNRGITLIALVITIIVLIILAGVSINLVLGDNGIITKAKEGKEDTIVGQEKEQVELAYVSAAVKKLGDNVTSEELQDELDISVGDYKTSVTGNDTLKVKFEDTKHEYIVSKNGNVSKYERINPTPVYAHVCDTDGNGKGETLVLSSIEDIEGYTITNNYGVIQERNKTDYSFYGTNKSTQITKIDIYDKISPTSTAYWFDGLTNLTEINNLSNLDVSNVTNMECMFYQCSNLKELDLIEWDTSKVTNMKCLFLGCENLERLNIKGFNTSSVTDFGNMFSGCKALKELNISGFDTSNATNMDSMFYDCKALESLDLSNFNTEKVTSIGRMFNGCNNLINVDVSSFNTTNVTDIARLFSRMQ